MNFFDKFQNRKKELNSLLCIGLDPELEKLPESIQKSNFALSEFCISIIDATSEFAASFKPNIAFFERFGSKGFLEFEKVIFHLTSNYPHIPIVADCKRGDLANTSKEYAKYFFGELKVDSITLSPYMGEDSIEPYLEYKNHAVFLLGLTSNPSSNDLQKLKSSSEKFFYEEVIDFSKKLNTKYKNQVGIVVGATHPVELKKIRDKDSEQVFLIPGFGAQGGSLETLLPICGKNSLINSSRSIIFASSKTDFQEAAHDEAKKIHQKMNELL